MDTVSIRLSPGVARDLIRFIKDPAAPPAAAGDPDWDAVEEACREALRDYDGPDEDPYAIGRLTSFPSSEQMREWQRLKD